MTGCHGPSVLCKQINLNRTPCMQPTHHPKRETKDLSKTKSPKKSPKGGKTKTTSSRKHHHNFHPTPHSVFPNKSSPQASHFLSRRLPQAAQTPARRAAAGASVELTGLLAGHPGAEVAQVLISGNDDPQDPNSMPDFLRFPYP